jgi:hypothetical protein
MSLLPAYISALRRKARLASTMEPEIDSHDRVFDLVPPRTSDTVTADENAEPEKSAEPDQRSEAAASSRSLHPVTMTDLTRLSIDNDGRLYWDGKPVEVRRSILMSRAQVIGAIVIGAFVVIGAIAAAIQGSTAVRDWACRLGWTQSYCALPDAYPQQRSTDIPA